MPLGFSKAALLGASSGGASEHWIGLFDSNTTYYANGTAGQVVDSGDNIYVMYQAYGSFDGSLAAQYMPFNACLDKEGELSWGKALGPATNGQLYLKPAWPYSVALKSETNNFVISCALNSGGQFGNDTGYNSNSPWLWVDVNESTGAMGEDVAYYRSYNSTIWDYGVLAAESHTISGTEYVYANYRMGDGSGGDSALGLMRYECDSGGGFGSHTNYMMYRSGVGQNIYVGTGNSCAHSTDSSGDERFATVGYEYKSGGTGYWGWAAFVPYIQLFDEDGANRNSIMWSYNGGTSQHGYPYGVVMDSSHNAYTCGMFNNTSSQAEMQINMFDSSANQQSGDGYPRQWKGDGTGGSYLYSIIRDSSGNFYAAGSVNINHDSVDNTTRAVIVKFNSSMTPQWWRAIDVDPVSGSSSRSSSANGQNCIHLNSDGNLVVSFTTGINEYTQMGVAVLPADGTGTGTYTVNGHTIDYIDIDSKITETTSSDWSSGWLAETAFTGNIGVTCTDTHNLTPGQRTGTHVPSSFHVKGVS